MNEDLVLLSGVVGSRAYGIHGPDSDTDRASVYAAPLDTFLGLKGSDPEFQVKSEQQHEPDVTRHEVGKFLNLCLGCRPAAMELLWLGEYDTLTEEGQALLNLRTAVLHTPGVRGAYLGYLNRQLADAQRDSKWHKPMGHALRLAWQARTLLATGELWVMLPADVKHAVLKVRRGAYTLEQATNLVTYHTTQLEQATSCLPDRPDRDLVNDTLCLLRRNLAGL